MLLHKTTRFEQACCRFLQQNLREKVTQPVCQRENKVFYKCVFFANVGQKTNAYCLDGGCSDAQRRDVCLRDRLRCGIIFSD